jgi:hypothetical protein
MNARDYFRRRRELRMAWNALSRATDAADRRHSFEAARDAAIWLAATGGVRGSAAEAAEWAVRRATEAGVSDSEARAVGSAITVDETGLSHEEATALLRDCVPVLWLLIEAETAGLSRSCPPSAAALMAARIVLSVCLAAAVAIGTTAGLMRLRQFTRPSGFWVTYYDNPDLTERRATRMHGVLFKDYGTEAPVFGMKTNAWSSRWETRLKVTETAEYTFITRCQDGVRLKINDQILIDNWREQDWNRSVRKAPCTLAEGVHTVMVEHVVYRGNGAIQVQWSGGPVRKRTDLGGSSTIRPSLGECRR